MSDSVLIAAILPVIALCYYVYKKDQHREPADLLFKLLGLGALTTIPAAFIERFLDSIFPSESAVSFIVLFINVFMGIAIIEEGLKWLIIKFKSYDNQEFDEIYDIIVYSVFTSLGFAAIENILYVLKGGMGVAILRAILSVPGHACFAVLMGYYFSKAKVAGINNNKSKCTTNKILSILVPTVFHTMYDALLIWFTQVQTGDVVLYFFTFDIIMVVICFITVNRVSKVQQNLSTNLAEGNIVNNNGLVEVKTNHNINFCPLCGNNVVNSNFCSKCGLKIR